MAEKTGKDLKNRFYEIFSNNDREAQVVLRLLLSAILNYEYSVVNFHLDTPISPEQELAFQEALDRIRTGEPVQHVIGSVEFFDLQIQVNSDVLIPRPETEELLFWIQEDFQNRSFQKAIDFCTGSGCIALGLKAICPTSRVEGVDISQPALSVAQKNAIQNNLQVDFYEFDVLEEHQPRQKVYDIIVSNPPYIPIQERELMDRKVVHFEPGLALFVENHEPLVFYDKIADLAQLLLKTDGSIYLELHEDYAIETVDLYRQKGFTDLVLKQDFQGKNRMLRVRR